jgi:hypothetical protein
VHGTVQLGILYRRILRLLDDPSPAASSVAPPT